MIQCLPHTPRSWCIAFHAPSMYMTTAKSICIIMCITPTSPAARYDARYIIPLAGMLLGSAVSGVSVGLTTVMEELSSGACQLMWLLTVCVPT